MIGLLRVHQRLLAVLGGISMYRLTLLALVVLAAIAVVLSAFGVIVNPTPQALMASLAVLVLSVSVVDFLAHRILRLPWRMESSLITALILLFVLQPGLDWATLAGTVIAGVLAAVSKYLVVWRGRHVVNPAAFGAAVVTIAHLGTASTWWVSTPSLAIPVLLLGVLVLWRTERLGVITVFVAVAVAVSMLRQGVQLSAAGIPLDLWSMLLLSTMQSPFFFLGTFMLSEPLTLPPRRRQQMAVAVVVGVLAGWPILVGDLFTLGQERALLIGNLVAFAFAVRRSVRLTLTNRDFITPTVRQLTFQAGGTLRFEPGQYVEIDVPHPRPDVRGTRREFSIASAPSDLPTVRIAYRDGGQQQPSSFKKALAAVQPGSAIAATGVWGDFVLPRGEGPLLMVAAGVGITPFVSQLRELHASGRVGDIVLVYVAPTADELAFRADIEHAGVRVVVVTRDEPADLPDNWIWLGGARLDSDNLASSVPDLGARHAFVSGPPRLIAELAPALRRAKSLTTDAFAGY